ncbi:MAG TPA: radical SAM protein [Dehalococcoidia bacterium]|nr:radical SAM protein [Dehalococcoidia bacterium]
MPSDLIFEEIHCKTVLNRVSVPGMRFSWSINPYRGCQHACVYCFARGTHNYLGYDSGRDFETRIIVKINATEVLREELRRQDRPKESVLLGTACDPYQQAEAKYFITQGIVKALTQFAQPVHMLSKSPLVLRDLDLWQGLAAVTRCFIGFSVPTLDEQIWRKLEPGTAKPMKRLLAMRQLVDAGVRCGVMLAPIVPGLTDDEHHLSEVMRSARDCGASFIGANVLHLQPGTKEWFMPALRDAYPHLLPRYEKFYRGSYAPRTYTQDVLAKVDELRDRFGFHEADMKAEEPRGQLRMAI